jgi:iron complex outermembrane receptor protein
MGFTSLGYAQNAISGTIKNQNNEPISNVEILILDATIQTKSNKDGQFEIKSLPIGKRTLIFKKEKFEIKSQTILIEKLAQINLDIVLEKEVHHIDEILISSVFGSR